MQALGGQRRRQQQGPLLFGTPRRHLFTGLEHGHADQAGAGQHGRGRGRVSRPDDDVVADPLRMCAPARRYSDPEVKKFKLNAERNNGRAAMMGITGMMIHNALGVDALFPVVQ